MFAEFVARKYQVRVTGITISDAQFDYARKRIARAGLGSRVEIRSQASRFLPREASRVAA